MGNFMSMTYVDISVSENENGLAFKLPTGSGLQAAQS